LLASVTVVSSMAPRAVLAELAALEAPNDAGPPPAQSERALSFQMGGSFYRISSTATAIFAGPKLTIGYDASVAGGLSFTAGVGLTLGACLQRGDEKDCAFRPGYAVEPLAGIVIKSRRAGRAQAYAKLLGGALLVVPDTHPVGAAALLRAGGGVRSTLSENMALGIEVTGAVGVGHFELNYQDVERQLVSLDLGAVLEARF
jgi:ABC-type amino acid transport substrate-binding protein